MPVAVDGRRRLAPEERKRLLLEYAIEAFSRRGIGRGGHTDIAEAGGVSVATVFNYFKTRDILVGEVLDEIAFFMEGIAEDAFRQEDNPLTAITTFFTNLLRACQIQSNHMRVWLEWSSSPREEVWPRYLSLQETLLEMLSQQVELAIADGIASAAGLPARERALWMLGNSQMLVTMMLDPMGKPDDIDGMLKRWLDHMLVVKTA
jgi:TetR/AcrR family transcriptional regulator, hemagglutinin/protease regulatory protein